MATAKEATPKPEPTKKAAPEPKQCACGCGGTTKGGQFLIGHDARHKSNLIAKALKGDKKAEDEIHSRKWDAFLRKSREVARKKAEAAAAAAKAKATAKPAPAGKAGATAK